MRWLAACLLGGAVFAGMPTAFAAGVATADCDAPQSYRVLEPTKFKATDARAYWLDASTIQWPGVARDGTFRLQRADGSSVALAPFDGALSKEVAERFRFIGDGPRFRLPAGSDARALLREPLELVRVDAKGRTREATRAQVPGALDALYGDTADKAQLGATVNPDITTFSVWAPTAREVSVCLYTGRDNAALVRTPLQRDDATGVWSQHVVNHDIGHHYAYLVDVFVPGLGMVRNRVTDPYSVALVADGTRSFAADLDAPALKPGGWPTAPPKRIEHNTDLVLYELHVRDFSIGDASVPAEHRGKYLAFTNRESNGMRHLRALAETGVTDVHLLPVFDFATVPERGCKTPTIPDAPPDSDAQQAAAMAAARGDCFNWGYEPAHFNAPEGSYATDPDDATRILEFRRMVQALHAAGLRVGMDVVYNHTTAAGQAPNSVLDRIVPGYYHRLDAKGAVERSTCCANTATEHRLMAKLMRDSVVLWATQYGIDSFRFDLMGHQPRVAMEALRNALREATGRDIPLLGEGWNFGEVADGARFVQASQRSLFGAGIGTFSDRARDAVRGGGPADHAPALVDAKGWSNGANDPALADLVRVGLSGTLRDYKIRHSREGGALYSRMAVYPEDTVPLSAIDYHGQPAGYAAAPSEVVNYVENHDNQTLFDINTLKLPPDTSTHDRARVQLLGAAVTAFSQGIAYYHAGIDVLRSKSLDRNSFDSGDHFNRLDWTYTDNGFGGGLPPAQDNRQDWNAMRPLLADAARIKPTPADIAFMRDAFRDLLRIRASSMLFRLRSAEDVQQRLTFPPARQDARHSREGGNPALSGEMDSRLRGNDGRLIIGRLDGKGLPDANFGAAQYFLNADPSPRTVTLPELRDEPWSLHPVHLAPNAADKRASEATFDTKTGRFSIPARTAVVFVQPASPEALPPLITTTLPAQLATQEDIRIDIQLPPHYDAKHRYPVLYVNDGQDLEAVRLRESLQTGYEDGSLNPLILVAIHMPKDRMAAYGLSDRRAGHSVIAPTKYGDVGTQAHGYSTWIVDALVPWIDAHYATQANANGRAILGWSLGALNAFNLGWQYPEVFGRVGAFSPSVWVSSERETAEDVQRTRLAHHMVDTGPAHRGFKAFFAVGTDEETDDRDNDGTIDVLDDTRDLITGWNGLKGLVQQGATFDEANPGHADIALFVLPGGKHQQPSWARMFPAFLRWSYSTRKEGRF